MESYNIDQSFIHLSLEKPPRMKKAQCTWATCSTAWLCSWGKKFLLISSLTLSELVVSHPPSMHHCEKPGSVFLMTFLRVLGAAVRPPQSHLFSRLNNAYPLASLQGVPALIISEASTELVLVCWCVFCIELFTSHLSQLKYKMI